MKSPDPFANLEGHQYMSLVTFRQNGEPVPTPVWFAREGDVLYVTTLQRSGKVKRLQHTARVTVAPCDRVGELLGPAVEAEGRLLATDEAREQAFAAIKQKYSYIEGLAERLAQNPMATRAFLAIRPAEST